MTGSGSSGGSEPFVLVQPILIAHCGPGSGGGAPRRASCHDVAIRKSERQRTSEPKLDDPALVVNLVVMVRAREY